jgi:hypothetical protein
VGESLFQVALAGLIAATSKAEPLALLGDAFATPGAWLAMLAFFAIPLSLYAVIWNRAARTA